MSGPSEKDLLMFGGYQLQRKDKKEPKKKNAKPEKILEKQILEWMRYNKFDVNVVEAKAAFNPKVGRYINSPTMPGVSDIFGNDIIGRAVYVELKAKGRISTLRENQFEFLKRKIITNSFAVCVDSVDKLEEYYKQWSSLPPNGRQEYLLQILERK